MTFRDVIYLMEEADIDVRQEYWEHHLPSPEFRVRCPDGLRRVVGFKVEQGPETEWGRRPLASIEVLLAEDADAS